MFKFSKYLMRNVACGLGPETHFQGVSNKKKNSKQQQTMKTEQNPCTRSLHINQLYPAVFNRGKEHPAFFEYKLIIYLIENRA